MSKTIHTCYTDAELSSTTSIPECNSECENVDLSKIGTLSDEDHRLYTSDISKTHYINQLPGDAEPNTDLYENMILEDTFDTTEKFDTNDDKFLRDLDDHDKISLNLLNEELYDNDLQDNKSGTLSPTLPETTSNHENNLSNNEQDEYHDVNIEDIDVDATFQGKIKISI